MATIGFSSSTIFYPKPLLPFSSHQNTREISLQLPYNIINQSPKLPESRKWRIGVSFFSSFLLRSTDVENLKQELLQAIAPLDRGAAATPEDQRRIDQVMGLFSFTCLIPFLYGYLNS